MNGMAEKALLPSLVAPGGTLCVLRGDLRAFPPVCKKGLMKVRPSANEILRKTSIEPDRKVRDLTEDEVARLREAIDDLTVEGDLRRERSQNIKRLMEIGSYKGLRHRRGLPANGQRTKTNARSRK